MNIENIEDNIYKILDVNYILIIELIVDAVNTFPLQDLKDTEDYFNEIKTLLKSNEITLHNLECYLKENEDLNNENSVWIIDSISSLVESFELMQLYEISFNQVRNKIESLSS